MKLLHLTFHFEFTDAIERILDKHEIENYARVGMIKGKDRTGKHQGSQIHPGNITLIQAQIPDDDVDDLLNDLQDFRRKRETHEHLEALILPIERRLGNDSKDA